MSEEQLNELREVIWKIAELDVGFSRYPFFDRTPTEQSAKLKNILQATDCLLGLLKSLDYKVGESLEEHPFDAPLMLAIQMASSVLGILRISVSPNPRDDYPVGVIRSLEHFRLAVARANEDIKPKRGNATNRELTSKLKSCIAKNLVFNHRSMSGKFPATTTDGWAASLLNDIFQHYGLGDDAGAYWVRREVAELKKAQQVD